MPEISETDYRQFVSYTDLGTPTEVRKKISGLESDNQKYRQETIPALEARLPKDDEVVIPKAKADLLPKYEELGDPDTLKKKVEDGEKAVSDLQQVNTKQEASKFATAAGLAEEAVDTLVALPELKDAKFEVRKAKVKNDKGIEEEREVAYVTLAGEGKKAMTFIDAQSEVPALKGLRTASTEPPKKGGLQFIQQPNGGSGGTQTIFDKIRADKEAEKTAAKDKPAVKPITERLGML